MVMIPFVLLMFILGFYPKPFLKEIDRSAKEIVKKVNPAGAVAVSANENTVRLN